MQALNVMRGGTLVQDIQSQIAGSIKHEQGTPALRNSHGLEIDKNSFLARLSSVMKLNGDVRVNSSHHQAIGKVGKDLEAVAWSADGVVECIHDPRDDRFVLGVQWHPELSTESDELSREIFELFVQRCSSQSESEPRVDELRTNEVEQYA
jgi:putative glutamine amidotransferase